jgi:hypothetical protein
MVRLTSLLTGWYKKAGPVLGFASLAVAFGLLGWLVWSGRIEVWWLVIPPVLALVGFLYMSRYTAVLVDDVQDAGDALLVHHRGRGWRIPLSTISEVAYSCIAHPPRITLVYRDAMGVVERLVFMPRLTTAIFAFRPPPVVEDLRRRVDAARGPDRA